MKKFHFGEVSLSKIPQSLITPSFRFWWNTFVTSLKNKQKKHYIISIHVYIWPECHFIFKRKQRKERDAFFCTLQSITLCLYDSTFHGLLFFDLFVLAKLFYSRMVSSVPSCRLWACGTTYWSLVRTAVASTKTFLIMALKTGCRLEQARLFCFCFFCFVLFCFVLFCFVLLHNSATYFRCYL